MNAKTIKLVGGIAASLSLSLLATSKVEAADFSFTNLLEDADNDGTIYRGSSYVSINDKGTAAFQYIDINLRYSSGYCPFVAANGNQTNLIQDVDCDITFTPLINNSGTVAFPGFDSILVQNGTDITTIAYDPNLGKLGLREDEDTTTGDLSLNNRGTVAFAALAFLDKPADGIFISNGGAIGTIADSSGIFDFGQFSSSCGSNTVWNCGIGNALGSILDINDRDVVAFAAPLDTGEQGIYIGNGTETINIATSTQEFQDFFLLADCAGWGCEEPFRLPSLSINNNNIVAFRATLDTGIEGIFTGDGTATNTIADTTGAFSFFEATSINNRGTVAFSAGLDDGRFGIFTGSNPLTDKVIATGDSLFGSTVTALSFYQEGLNNVDQIAFKATLADGRTVFSRANAVPEPLSILGTIALGVFGAGYRRSQHKLSARSKRFEQ